MNAKISVIVICVEAIKYLSLCNLHDSTFKQSKAFERLDNNVPKALLLSVAPFQILSMSNKQR